MSAKRLAVAAARPLHSPSPMTHLPSSLEVVPADQLSHVTGGGIGSVIGGLFGAKGAKWGGFADQILGMIQGMGSGGASAASSAASSSGSSGDGSSGGGGGGGGGGGWMSFLGNLGKIFGGFGGMGGKQSGGGDPSAGAGGDQ
jgi:hypothetical protein